MPSKVTSRPGSAVSAAFNFDAELSPTNSVTHPPSQIPGDAADEPPVPTESSFDIRELDGNVWGVDY